VRGERSTVLNVLRKGVAMRRAIGVLMVIGMALCGCRTQMEPPAAPAPVTATPAPGAPGDGWLGEALRNADDGQGVVVALVLPGPLDGGPGNPPLVSRGDLVRSLNGEPVTTAKQFTELVKQHRAGEVVKLGVTRTGGNPDSAIPAPGKERKEMELAVTLAKKSEWTGPLFGEPPGGTQLPEVVQSPTPFETYLRGQLAAQHLEEPVDKLVAYFAETQKERGGADALSRVNYTFYHPLELPELARFVTDPLATLKDDPRQVLVQGAANLDTAAPALGEPIDLTSPAVALAQLGDRMTAARGHLDEAFAKLPPALQAKVAAQIDGYMKTQDPLAGDVKGLIDTLRGGMHIDYPELLAAGGELAGLMVKGEECRKSAPTVSLPGALRKIVKGDILAAVNTPEGWLVYGGFGHNEYDLSKLAGVIDAGGDDTYRYSTDAHPAVQVVVDCAGNDTYLATNGGGPASATLGVNLLVDWAGDDGYEGTLRACGSGLMGIGVLLDYGGNDMYRGTAWGIGSAFYGIGAVLDLGSGSDVYWAAHASEGLGGPKGFGLLFDAGGDDLYRANGPTESGYGTPAVFYGLSQGVGFGIRGYETGGIGILEDLGGSDRYEAGEFSQGGGYYWGLGILDDRGGNDLYYANRYGQGFGCHQAVGALLDHGGNDTYWAMTAANQGCAWDVGVGLLLDYAGDDCYLGANIAQGSGANQGSGWLIDPGGTDHYSAWGPSVQGMSQDNPYHYTDSKCGSFSLLLDAGGTDDFYSAKRQHGSAMRLAIPNATHPERALEYGLFIDTPTATDVGLGQP